MGQPRDLGCYAIVGSVAAPLTAWMLQVSHLSEHGSAAQPHIFLKASN